jgi:hypothetical protein
MRSGVAPFLPIVRPMSANPSSHGQEGPTLPRVVFVGDSIRLCDDPVLPCEYLDSAGLAGPAGSSSHCRPRRGDRWRLGSSTAVNGTMDCFMANIPRGDRPQESIPSRHSFRQWPTNGGLGWVLDLGFGSRHDRCGHARASARRRVDVLRTLFFRRGMMTAGSCFAEAVRTLLTHLNPPPLRNGPV